MASQSSSGLLEDADEFVREYLAWRGFYSTLQTFGTENKEDALLGLSSSKLVSRLLADIDGLNLERVFQWWDESIGPLLGRVDEEVAALGRSLRDSSYRLYLVNCSKEQRTDLILSFFQNHWTVRIASSRYRDEWRKNWFVLPYTSFPERDRYFAVFFSSEWRNSFGASLESFLGSLLAAISTPRLLAVCNSKDSVDALETEINMLRKQSSDLGQPERSITHRILETEDRPSTISIPSIPNKSDLKAFGAQLLTKRHGEVMRVRYSPNCTQLASTGRDATCVVVNLEIDTGTPRIPRLFCDSSASCLDWFDNNLLSVGTLDHAVHLWSPSGNRAVTTIRTHATLPHVLDVAFDPTAPGGSSIIISAAPAMREKSGELQVWNSSAERLDRVLPVDPVPARFNSIRFNHNGSLLVAGSEDGMVRVFDSGRAGAIMGWPASGGSGISAICLSRNETSVFALSSDCLSLAEYSLHRVGELLRKWRLPDRPRTEGGPFDLAVSDKNIAATSAGIATILSLDDVSGEPLNIPGVSSVDWDEKSLACGFLDGSVKIFPLAIKQAE